MKNLFLNLPSASSNRKMKTVLRSTRSPVVKFLSYFKLSGTKSQGNWELDTSTTPEPSAWSMTQEGPGSLIRAKETFIAAFLRSAALHSDVSGVFFIFSFFSPENLHQEQHCQSVTLQGRRYCNASSWKPALRAGREIKNFGASGVASYLLRTSKASKGLC